MKNLNKLCALLLALVMVLSPGSTAFAAVEDTGYSDVAADAWYAEAVIYCTENELMNGVSETTFAPLDSLTRAMLATVLYRAAGSPQVTDPPPFTDAAPDMWYSDAISWAAQAEVIVGYGNNIFGVGDPVTREQVATIFWRQAGSPSVERGVDYADAETVSAYAADAVAWAQEYEIMPDTEASTFAPQNDALRAEIASVLMAYAAYIAPENEASNNSGNKVLIAYFTRTGNTQVIVQQIEGMLDADTFRIVPTHTYPEDYTATTEQASQELEDNFRPQLTETVENMDEYDTIIIGYPIWWGTMPMAFYTFLESYDFSDKTVIPFSTHEGSGLGSSVNDIKETVPDATVLDGIAIRGENVSSAQSNVETWLRGHGIIE